MEDIDHLLVY